MAFDLVAVRESHYKLRRISQGSSDLASAGPGHPIGVVLHFGGWEQLAMVALRHITLLAVIWFWFPCAASEAADPPSLNGGGVQMDLKSQLEKGLRARRPVEFAYIADIVKLVEEKKLPYALVTSTYGWAVQQPERQLQYFQFALQSRAKKLGVQLPNLANQAVSPFGPFSH